MMFLAATFASTYRASTPVDSASSVLSSGSRTGQMSLTPVAPVHQPVDSTSGGSGTARGPCTTYASTLRASTPVDGASGVLSHGSSTCQMSLIPVEPIHRVSTRQPVSHASTSPQEYICIESDEDYEYEPITLSKLDSSQTDLISMFPQFTHATINFVLPGLTDNFSAAIEVLEICGVQDWHSIKMRDEISIK